MATHSGVLAWRIPGTGEPGGLPSMGSHRVRHDRSDLAAAAAACTHTLSFSSSFCPSSIQCSLITYPVNSGYMPLLHILFARQTSTVFVVNTSYGEFTPNLQISMRHQSHAFP